MQFRQGLILAAIAAGIGGCGGGDVNLNISTADNSVDNSTTTTGSSNNPCAFYTDPASNTERRGSFDGTNCTYPSSFVGATNPLTVDLTIPFISGVHIFQDSLFVGQNVTSGAAPASGTGPTLTIEAGNKLAFSNAGDYLLVNRGSRIIADGSPTAPITFTGFTDVVTRTAGPEDVQLWGGVVLNGNGITNNCTDSERTSNQCHVVSEGKPSNYGGNDNGDDSGILRYVIIKHAGFEVAPGDELNGLTLNAVGSGTTIENIEIYSAYDDGVEFFGGAANVTNLIALYARDDSIDFSDGYVGRVDHALVIHSATNGNRCIEGDNIGAGRSDAGQAMDLTPQSNPTITNLTCITSNFDAGTHGDSEGPLLRQGALAQIADSIVYGGYGTSKLGYNSNECLEIESDVSLAAAQAGDSTFTNSIIACSEATKGSLPNGDTVGQWVTDSATYTNNTGNTIITDAANANVSLLEPGTFYTATTLTDAAGAAITVAPVSGQLGAVTRANDWTAGWAFGLRAGNRAEPLWFE
ncbi:MAG: hypothetical protein R3E77_01095 [Steroidobacteraceae bacterium]